MQIQGEVASGLGEGKDYIGLEPYQEKIQKITGFYPFPGTLNVETSAEKVRDLKEEVEYEVIESFEWNGNTYSRVEVYPVEIEGVKAAYLDIEITDHGDNLMELVAEQNLRDSLGLEDGDFVKITLR
ncbi:MAG: riboflavin kinase [Candidatus Nanohaloarchaea archaeon]|jgi:riboflavin kinase